MRTKSSRISNMALGAIALAGLALAGTGCIIESSGGSCQPDLFVPYDIVQNVAGDPLITCAQAGADHVEIDVNQQTTFSQSCPANATGGEFQIPLGGKGSYTLDVFLMDGDLSISEAHPPTISVNCLDSTTPVVVLPVNL